MARIGAKVAENADKVVRQVAMVADQTVVMATPVDKGRARANWIAALDAPALGITESTDFQGALAAAASKIATYDGDKNTSIHLTNNLSYIGPLNDGSSRQAPAGFVRRAVRAAVAIVPGARLLEGA